MVVNGQTTLATPSESVRDRLDDPRVAEALNSLLDHADLLAILVAGLDGLVKRGDDIAANLTSAVGELKGSGAAGAEMAKQLDLGGLAVNLLTLSGGLAKATPAINALLNSSLADPRGAEVVSALGDALVSGRTALPPAPRGVRGMWKTVRTAAKDPDIGRGLVYLIEVARAFGRKV